MYNLQQLIKDLNSYSGCKSPPFPVCTVTAGFHENLCERYGKTGREFEYVRNKFPNVRDAKIKEKTFTGPQIRELMQDKQFDEKLNVTERNAWLSFSRICKDFL